MPRHLSGERPEAGSSSRPFAANLVAQIQRGSTRHSRGREPLLLVPGASTPRVVFARHGTSALTALCDTSVVIKWFLSTNEDDVASANEILIAHRDGRAALRVISLVREELANALLRGRGQTASQVREVLAAARRTRTGDRAGQ